MTVEDCKAFIREVNKQAPEYRWQLSLRLLGDNRATILLYFDDARVYTRQAWPDETKMDAIESLPYLPIDNYAYINNIWTLILTPFYCRATNKHYDKDVKYRALYYKSSDCDLQVFDRFNELPTSHINDWIFIPPWYAIHLALTHPDPEEAWKL